MSLYVWVDNPSDVPIFVMTCMDLDHFKARGFDLFDAYGHRVLRKYEVKIQERCKTNPDVASLSNL